MISVSIQFGPGNQPGVLLRRSGPDRLELRGGLRRPWLVWAALGFALAGWGQLDAWQDRAWPRLLGATIVATAMAAALFLRRRLTVDRATWTAVDGIGLFGRLSGDARSIAGVKRVVVRQEVAGGGEHAETRYPTTLWLAADSVPLDRPGTWEAAWPVAESVARFLNVPLQDEVAHERRAAAALDVALRDRGPGPPPPARPQALQSVVLFDRETRLRVRIPMPSVPQIAGLNVLVALFCLIPFTAMVVLPLLNGSLRGSAEIARNALGALFPVLLVGGASLLAVFGNGGLLDVTPARLRLVQNGLLWRREVVIPAAELEDLIQLAPEWGGARSLLAYFSDGVLVARSDHASVRFGYGLPRKELDWLRARVHEVLRASRAARGRGEPDGAAAETAQGDARSDPPRELPWLIAAGGVLGAVAGNVSGGPLGASVALPFLEHALNLGTVLGALLGAQLDPAGAGRNSRRLAVALLAAGGLFAAMGWLGAPALVQWRPSFDEAALLEAHAPGEQKRLALGFLPWALAADAGLVHGLLWLAFWRSRRRACAALSPAQGVLAGDAVTRVAGLAAVLAVAAAVRFPAPPAPWPEAATAPPAMPFDRRPAVPVERVDDPVVPAAGEGVVHGHLRWAGRLANEVTQLRPRFWFRDEQSGTETDLRSAYDVETGRYRVAAPPGRYLLEATFGSPRQPGAAWIGSTTFTLEAGAELPRDVALSRVIRLVDPVESTDHPGASDTPPVLASPVRFAWEAVPGAIGYRYRIDPLRAEGGPASAPVEGEVPLPRLALALSPGGYTLHLHAEGPPGTGTVGHLEVYRPGFRAWALEFVVR